MRGSHRCKTTESSGWIATRRRLERVLSRRDRRPRIDRQCSGSDTSANALFGNLQVVASNQLQLNPILFAATNDSGGALGKMISPQNLTTAVSVTDLKGQEGVVFARTFVHSIVLKVLLCILVVIQQYVIPGIIPHAAAAPH